MSDSSHPDNHDKSGEARSRILQAACECIIEESTEAFTLKKVAKRAGASIGLITYHFDSKNELMIAALQLTAQRIAEFRNSSSSRGTAASLKRSMNFALTQEPDLGVNWPFRLAYIAKAVHEPLLRQHYAELTSRIRNGWVAVVRKETAEAPKLEPNLVADMLLALFLGLGIEITVDQEKIPPSRAVEILDAFFNLVGLEAKTIDVDRKLV